MDAGGTYLPISHGRMDPRIVLGQSSPKVEVVAVLACLFRAHHLRVRKESGEGSEIARRRLIKCINDVNLEILLRMRDADRVELICTEA